jgi:hypothetical protein
MRRSKLSLIKKARCQERFLNCLQFERLVLVQTRTQIRIIREWGMSHRLERQAVLGGAPLVELCSQVIDRTGNQSNDFAVPTNLPTKHERMRCGTLADTPAPVRLVRYWTKADKGEAPNAPRRVLGLSSVIHSIVIAFAVAPRAVIWCARAIQRVSMKRRSKSHISGKPTRSCSSLIGMLEMGAP